MSSSRSRLASKFVAIPGRPSRKSVNGGIGGGKDGYSGHVTFYVEVPDLEAALSKIEGLGGGTVMPPDQVPVVRKLRCFATSRATSSVSFKALLDVRDDGTLRVIGHSNGSGLEGRGTFRSR